MSNGYKLRETKKWSDGFWRPVPYISAVLLLLTFVLQLSLPEESVEFFCADWEGDVFYQIGATYPNSLEVGCASIKSDSYDSGLGGGQVFRLKREAVRVEVHVENYDSELDEELYNLSQFVEEKDGFCENRYEIHESGLGEKYTVVIVTNLGPAPYSNCRLEYPRLTQGVGSFTFEAEEGVKVWIDRGRG